MLNINSVIPRMLDKNMLLTAKHVLPSCIIYVTVFLKHNIPANLYLFSKSLPLNLQVLASKALITQASLSSRGMSHSNVIFKRESCNIDEASVSPGFSVFKQRNAK